MVLLILYLYMCLHMHATRAYGGQETTYGSWFSQHVGLQVPKGMRLGSKRFYLLSFTAGLCPL